MDPTLRKARVTTLLPKPVLMISSHPPIVRVSISINDRHHGERAQSPTTSHIAATGKPRQEVARWNNPLPALPRLVANPAATREIIKSAAAMLLQILGPAAHQWKPLVDLLIHQVLQIFFPETGLPAGTERAQEPAPQHEPAPAQPAQPAVSPAMHAPAQPDTAMLSQTQPASPPVSTSPATSSWVTVARRAAATPGKQPQKPQTSAVLSMAPKVENRMLSVHTRGSSWEKQTATEVVRATNAALGHGSVVAANKLPSGDWRMMFAPGKKAEALDDRAWVSKAFGHGTNLVVPAHCVRIG